MSRTNPRPFPRRVLMLGYDEAQILDITGPLQILSSALTPEGKPAYAIELVAPKAGPVAASAGLTLQARRGIGQIPYTELSDIDTFLVSGGFGSRTLRHDEAVLAFIREAATRARRTASICTGALLLAAAGLLDGKRATTHWAFAATLRRDFPKIEVDEDAIYVREGNLWTSAGVTAGMDLALALVEEDLGRDTALAIARHHVMYLMRPGGQSQFSAQLAAQAIEDQRIAQICAYIVQNPRAELTVPKLAAQAHMSERNFARRFAEAAAMTPALFVERARLDEARRRLTDGALPLETVAYDAGFGVAERMRRAFIRHLGVTPHRYRERFQTARRTATPATLLQEISHAG
ncbi:MAG: DJ-1/PfpI family protein [Parvibaculum sp.]|uniref:GlxA family transcriptional regulator n=1 Tax=Parvibaculum sp. TaxID=2024848 RepID=UPI0025F0FC91|nr:DJ-1/PfpI family protein [Parvibaculum sp.]MCE9649749.1 DJ-1/PfpI family protein [Parvibaculum sp.]